MDIALELLFITGDDVWVYGYGMSPIILIEAFRRAKTEKALVVSQMTRFWTLFSSNITLKLSAL